VSYFYYQMTQNTRKHCGLQFRIRIRYLRVYTKPVFAMDILQVHFLVDD